MEIKMERTYHLKNVIYFPSLNSIGGVETFCYEMGYKFGKDFDITVFYREGDPNMVKHIGDTCRIIKYKPGDKIICDVFIFAYAYDILDFVEAKEYIQTYHADYVCRHLNVSHDPRITRRFGVAENTTIGIRDHLGVKDIETMYNPYTPKKVDKVLYLISATRLTAEKGYKRMLKFADVLDQAGVKYLWTIYTDKPVDTERPNMICLPPRLDIVNFIAKADYLVQLSDTEGYSYTLVEALSVGTPVICTPISVAEEQGIIDGVTGFIIPFDVSEVPVQRIQNGLKKFQYTPRESHYDTVLSPGKSTYDEDMAVPVETVSIRTFFDIQLNRIVQPKEQITMKRGRAEFLEDGGFVTILS